MNIDSINSGIVIDHITAGQGMEIYRLLGLESLDCQVAVIRNAQSHRLGKKDIIKIDAVIPLDLDLLGYTDPGVTINIIHDGVITEKKHPRLPERLTGVLKCRNPRCITTTEQELTQIFVLTDPEQRVYRCIYCEAKNK